PRTPTPPTPPLTLPLHAALPISGSTPNTPPLAPFRGLCHSRRGPIDPIPPAAAGRTERHPQPAGHTARGWNNPKEPPMTNDEARDRKSTRLNSSHVKISYAVFCL